MPTLSKHGKRVGSPPGAAHRDFRPRVVALIQRYRILEHAVKLYDREKEKMSVKDQLGSAKILIDFAIAASPKTIETPDAGSTFELHINGIPQRQRIDETAQRQEPGAETPAVVTRALPDVKDYGARQPHFPASRPRPAVDTSPPSVPDAFAVRAPFGPPEKSATPSQVDQASEGQIRMDWVPDNVGDGKGQMFIDGTPVGREIIPARLVPETVSQAPPGEVEELRQENDALREQQELVAANAKILSNPLMKDILSEYVESGQIEPPRPPPPSSRDVLEYNLRRSDPDFPVVQGILREWAETLPPHETAALNENHALFVREYDRIKAESGGRLPKARSSPLPASYPSHLADRRTLETIIRSKEVVRARVEPPGPSMGYSEGDDEQRSATKEFFKQRERLRRSYESGRETKKLLVEKRGNWEMGKPFRDMLDRKSGPKKSQPSQRGRAIAEHREKHGDQAAWSAIRNAQERRLRAGSTPVLIRQQNTRAPVPAEG